LHLGLLSLIKVLKPKSERFFNPNSSHFSHFVSA